MDIWKEVVVVTGSEAITEACQRRATDFDGRPNSFRNRYISMNYSDLVFSSGSDRVWWMRRFVEQQMTEHMGGVHHVEQITLDVLRGLVQKLGGMGSETAFNPVPLITDASLQILHVLMFREQLRPGQSGVSDDERYQCLGGRGYGFW